MDDATLSAARLALVGFGVENRALGRYLAARGLRFAVCDANPACRNDGEPLDASVTEWRLGGDCFAHLDDFTVLFRSPGIPVRHPDLQTARRTGVELSSQTALFLDRCPASVLAVTGTKGKGTTASLVASILQRAALPFRLGGNIGIPPVTFLDELTAATVVVLELSSFQLQGLGRSPHGAVVLPVTSDHLDYHADRDEYVEAKGEICRHQRAADWVVASVDSPTARQLASHSPGRQLACRATGGIDGDGSWSDGTHIHWRDGWVSHKLASVADLPLRGVHNLGNACAAAAAARLCGASAEAVAEGIRLFPGLEHRLEEVAERGGVLYVNDSLATTPEAAVAGLQAYSGRPIVLIAGGATKGAAFQELGAAIRAQARALVILGEEGERIAAAARAAGFSGPLVDGGSSMSTAVAQARSHAVEGGVVLLSPGCASFGMFADYAERGAAFRAAVEA